MNFTPGPWRYQRAPKQQHAIDRKWEVVAPTQGGGETVIVGEHTGIDCLKERDARLIAAAPELLEALERLHIATSLILQSKPVRDMDEALSEAVNVIAKARGEV